MKIRIKGNSVRLRLTQTEVDQLLENGEVQEQTSFPNATLDYRIQLSDSNIITISFTDSKITILIPEDQGVAWCKSDEVGLENWIPVGKEEDLRILIEKDFACLTVRPHEDESDMFPNPNTTC